MAKKSEIKIEVGTHKNKIAENNTQQQTPEQPKKLSDAQQTKNIAWLAYILFFIPLLIDAKSPFVRHHANEGLEINIFDAIGLTLLLIGTLVTPQNVYFNGVLLIFILIGAGLLLLTFVTKIYMIVTTLQGKQKNTPWFWDLRIIK